jgi:hypothetical protein
MHGYERWLEYKHTIWGRGGGMDMEGKQKDRKERMLREAGPQYSLKDGKD